MNLLRAEWIKLRSLRSTAWCLALSVVVTILLSTWIVSTSKFFGELPTPMDAFSFAHRPMSGDGSIVAHVADQEASHPWAKAGIILKDGLTSGSPYAAMMVTPAHGVRWETGFTTDRAGTLAGTPWLKLTRTAATVTGYESADGIQWQQVGATTLAGLPDTVEVGLFVTSPLILEYMQGGGSTGIGMTATVGRAVFDQISVPASGQWAYRAVAPQPQEGTPQRRPGPGEMAQNSGSITVTGDGDISWYGIPSYERPDARDLVSDSLQGVQVGLLAVLVLGVLAAAGEYRSGTIRPTFLATPRRDRVLAAKAAVVGVTTFAAGLVAAVASFLIAQPILQHRGMRPPAYAYRTLAQPDVVRAVIGTAAFLALLAVLGVAAGFLLRRSSRAIPLMIALILLPQFLSVWLSLDAAKWLIRATPAAGLAIQQTIVRFDTAIGPWSGLAVLAAYTAAGYALALWRLRRRDA